VVIPRYGFEKSEAGVEAMLRSFSVEELKNTDFLHVLMWTIMRNKVMTWCQWPINDNDLI
jgi:hypothetical protein